MSTQETLDIRPSPIAGHWYPGTEGALRRELANLMAPYSEAKTLDDKTPAEAGLIALVVPHAGYFYSGATAAAAFQAILGQNYQKVLVISPSHRAYSERLLTSGHDVYETPFGLLPVDHDFLKKLNAALNNDGHRLSAVRFDQEHALEIELPFLQYCLKGPFDLVPIMMQDQSQKTAKALSQALYTTLQSLDVNEKVLLVASSDLSHFYPQKRAKTLDEAFIKALQSGDESQLYQALNDGKTEACGLGPSAVILALSKMLGANTIKIADYRDSSHASGDKSSVVGYVSAIISRKDHDHA